MHNFTHKNILMNRYTMHFLTITRVTSKKSCKMQWKSVQSEISVIMFLFYRKELKFNWFIKRLNSMLPLLWAYIENKIVTKSIFCSRSSLRGSRAHLCVHYYTLIVSLILACTKEKRNNVFHEGHVVQRRACKVLPADTCLPDIHHCSSGSS